MRNVDQIKELESEAKELRLELGRYKKKVADQLKLLAKKDEELETFRRGLDELNAIADGTISALLIAHGQAVTDDENPDVIIGHQMEVPIFSVEEVYGQYKGSCRRDESRGVIVYGTMERTV